MTEEQRELWKTIDQINGQIEMARTRYVDFRLCNEPEFRTAEGLQFEAELTELIRHGAMARIKLRETLKK